MEAAKAQKWAVEPQEKKTLVLRFINILITTIIISIIISFTLLLISLPL
jgi:hypothetical protein